MPIEKPQTPQLSAEEIMQKEYEAELAALEKEKNKEIEEYASHLKEQINRKSE